MKKIYLILFGVLISMTVKSQVLSPSVVAAGGAYYSAPTASLSFTVGELAIDTYTGGNGVLTQGFQQGDRPVHVTGQVTYANVANTPMPATMVYLKIPGGAVVDSALTNSSGHFFFYNVPSGVHVFTAKTSLPLSSVNATDALLVLQHFVHLITLSGMKKAAADVDASGYINSVDALTIAKRFTVMITSFPSGDWLFTKDTINAMAFPFTHNLKALCFGDVNASNIPSLKLSQSAELVEKGVKEYTDKNRVEIPFIADESNAYGSISWVMNLPTDGFDVQSVRMNSSDGQLVYNVVDHRLRLCWYSLIPMDLRAHDTMFFLTASISDELLKHTENLKFSLSDETSFSNEAAESLTQLSFTYPELKYAGPLVEPFMSANYPNPFSFTTTFTFGLTQQSHLRIRIFDLPGREILSLDKGILPIGISQVIFDASTLCQGTYFYEIEGTDPRGKFVKTGKLVLER